MRRRFLTKTGHWANLARILPRQRRAMKQKISLREFFDFIVAGPAGFEPANDGTKTRCLTTWRRPNLKIYYHKTPN